MPSKIRYLFFDTETNGLPGKAGRNREKTATARKYSFWPRIVQLAWILTDEHGQILSECCFLVRPDGWEMSPSAQRCHGISTQKAAEEGLPISTVLQKFSLDLWQTKTVIAHNIDFDLPIVGAEFQRARQGNPLVKRSGQCTMKIGADFLQKRPSDPTDSPLHLKSPKGDARFRLAFLVYMVHFTDDLSMVPTMHW